MKAILISTNPEWVAKILNGEKTIEIRKTAPKCDLPIKVYIYCTQGKYLFSPNGLNEHWWVQKYFSGEGKYNGKVVAKFTLRKVDWFCTRDFWGEYKEGVISVSDSTDPAIVRKSCVSQQEIDEYTKGKPAYAWHIEDLEIFDEPKELDGFDYPNPSGIRTIGQRSIKRLPSKKHPPQSWCYVEER